MGSYFVMELFRLLLVGGLLKTSTVRLSVVQKLHSLPSTDYRACLALHHLTLRPNARDGFQALHPLFLTLPPSALGDWLALLAYVDVSLAGGRTFLNFLQGTWTIEGGTTTHYLPKLNCSIEKDLIPTSRTLNYFFFIDKCFKKKIWYP